MQLGARLLAAEDILQHAEREGLPLDRVCDTYFKSRRFIGSGDRRFIGNLVFAIMRHQQKLDWWITNSEKFALSVNAINRVLAAAVLLEKITPEAIAADTGQKYGLEKLSAEQAAWLERLVRLDGDIINPRMPDYVRAECPEWIYDRLVAEYGADAAAIGMAQQTEAPVDLRINTIMAERAAVLAEIKTAIPDAAETPHSPWGIRLLSRQSFGQLPCLKDGRAEVQDEGSQLLAQFCAATPGMQVLDYCAGAGGKTLALAMQMANKGRIVAADTAEFRLKNAATRLRRAGVHNYELKLLDSDGRKWLRRQKSRFDLVLCDVPCTGTGTWRRNPDLRYRFTPESLLELLTLQQTILAEAANFLKPEGRLVYATCSLLRDENEAQIEKFLEANAGWQQTGTLKLNPARDGTDGFFGVVLQKLAS